MLRKVISGCQTGVDRAGLLAAYNCGYTTGGLVPSGYKFLDGQHPEFATIYGVQQHTSDEYMRCVVFNVRDADGTIGFAIPWKTKLYNFIGRACQDADCHYISIAYKDPVPHQTIADWVLYYDIKVLNIVGSPENISPGIAARAYEYMCNVFKLLKG